MSSGRLGYLRWLSMAGLALLVAVLAVSSNASPVRADLVNDQAACWVTGPLGGDYSGADDQNQDQGEEGFGGEKEYALDTHDFWQMSRLRNVKLKPKDGYWGYFTNFPEAIDFTFAMTKLDMERYPDDSKVGDLEYLIESGDVKDDDRCTNKCGSNEIVKIPFESRTSYVMRRAVGNYMDDRVESFSALWVDDRNPGGGAGQDTAAIIQDQQGDHAEVLAHTDQIAMRGSRTITSQGEQIVVLTSGTVSVVCANDACTLDDTLESASQTATVNQVAVDQNNREEYVNEVGDEVLVSERDAREGVAGGYDTLFASDTPYNRIHVNIELNADHREDYKWNLIKNNAFEDLFVLGMGYRTWAFPYARGQVPHFSLGAPGGFDRPLEVAPAVSGVSGPRLGYRQNVLGPAYYGGTAGIDAIERFRHDDDEMDDWDRIRWPVNIEDLNWYLYELPGTVGSPQMNFWLSRGGGNWLIGSGYGKTAQDYSEVPVCGFESDGSPTAADPDAGLDGVPLVGKVACDKTASQIAMVSDRLSPDEGELVKGELRDVYYPFEIESSAPDSGRTLDQVNFQANALAPAVLRADGFPLDALMVRAGVSSPVDAGDGVPRGMNRFDFVVDEQRPLNAETLSAQGDAAMARHGAPIDGVRAEEFFGEWPSHQIGPNRAYLMVVTYYESYKADRDIKTDNVRHFEVDGSGLISGAGVEIDDSEVRIPERHIRRVICRMVVYPAGFSPSADDSKNFFTGLFNKVTGGIKAAVSSFGGLFTKFVRAIAEVPAWTGKSTTSLVCSGVSKTEEITSSDTVPLAVNTVDEDGAVVVNVSAAAREDALSLCRRVEVPYEVTCQTGSDAVIRGECVNLPEMDLTIAPMGHRFLDPADNPNGLGYIGQRIYQADPGDPMFERVFQTVNRSRPSPQAMGLSEIRVDFDFAWKSVETELYDSVDGYVVKVYPDEKVFQGRDGEPFIFILPRYVWEKIKMNAGDAVGVVPVNNYHQLKGFWVGGLDHVASDDKALAHPSAQYGHPASDVLEDSEYEFRGLGGSLMAHQFNAFNNVVGNLPLAPGYTHKFEMAPYVGVAESNRFVIGPFSRPLILHGSEMACVALERDSNGLYIDTEMAYLYECKDLDLRVYQADLTEGDSRIGLLSLTGSNICGDIFSSTPPKFTWDNPVVKRMWGLMWIIAGSVFFVLLIWQALRMTYDMWIDPRPAVGFRELVPRYLIALAMAAGSWYICKWTLILGSDITCFVAQTTGMSLWGVIQNTFLAMGDGFLQVYVDMGKEIVSQNGAQVYKGLLVALATGSVMLLVFLIMLFLFLKVALAMLIRLALLAVLVSLSPLAMVFFASDTTSHWTKKWVSLFLGATFQQVVVLIVIYIGGHLVGSYIAEGESSIESFIVGILLGILTLALADKVPKLINPAGEGMFSSFGDMFKMAAAGALVATTAGIGLAAGAAGGMMGGAGGAVGMGGGGGGLGAGGAAAGGAAGGGGAGGGGAGIASSGAAGGAQVPGGTASSSSGGYATVGSGAGGPGGGMFSGLGQRMSGFARDRLPSSPGEGFRAGINRGTGFNTRMRDVTQGNVLYRNSSAADDTAAKLEQMGGMDNDLKRLRDAMNRGADD